MADKLESKIEGQKMSRGGSTLDRTALMVPAVGFGVMVLLMTAFYVYYRRKQNRHQPMRPLKKTNEQPVAPSRSGRKRGQTLAESGGLPPVRPSRKGASS